MLNFATCCAVHWKDVETLGITRAEDPQPDGCRNWNGKLGLLMLSIAAWKVDRISLRTSEGVISDLSLTFPTKPTIPKLILYFPLGNEHSCPLHIALASILHLCPKWLLSSSSLHYFLVPTFLLVVFSSDMTAVLRKLTSLDSCTHGVTQYWVKCYGLAGMAATYGVIWDEPLHSPSLIGWSLLATWLSDTLPDKPCWWVAAWGLTWLYAACWRATAIAVESAFTLRFIPTLKQLQHCWVNKASCASWSSSRSLN